MKGKFILDLNKFYSCIFGKFPELYLFSVPGCKATCYHNVVVDLEIRFFKNIQLVCTSPALC